MSPESEAAFRLSAFIGVFFVLAVAEALWPRRALEFGRFRWFTNVGLSALNTLLLRLSYFVMPMLGVIAATYAEGFGWGVLPFLGISGWAAIILAFVALDLAVYLQHLAFHAVPALWRLHRVHHADPEIDVSTGIRFHPFEIAISQVWKIAVVLTVGAPALAVILFEVALNATSMFSHSNIRVPLNVDAILRRVIVTPEMHRIHHSTLMHETNSNFGFNFSFWDRLFGTYRPLAERDQMTMPIGLVSYQSEEPIRFFWLLQFPFRRGPEA